MIQLTQKLFRNGVPTLAQHGWFRWLRFHEENEEESNERFIV